MNRTPEIISRKAFYRNPEDFEEKFVRHKEKTELKYKIALVDNISGWFLAGENIV
ncbi:hypothetical protein [Mariniphaga sp.]|uniref:hypothetical protein n=1 Tax=Mariniphaga sp. TaxID=1954475 RepID=UPI00356970E1